MVRIRKGTRGGVNVEASRWRVWVKLRRRYRTGFKCERGPYGSLSGSMSSPFFVATFIRRYPESRLRRAPA